MQFKIYWVLQMTLHSDMLYTYVFLYNFVVEKPFMVLFKII